MNQSSNQAINQSFILQKHKNGWSSYIKCALEDKKVILTLTTLVLK